MAIKLERALSSALAFAMALALMLCLACPSMASAQTTSSQSSDESQSQYVGHVFVIEAPFLTWGDISEQTTPNLNSIMDSSGLGNAFLRSYYRDSDRTISPAEAMGTISSGYWVADPYGLTTQSQFYTRGSEIVSYGDGPVLSGRLGSVFSNSDWKTLAFGCSDYDETICRPAAALTVGSSNRIDISDTQAADDLVDDSDWAYGVRTDLGFARAWVESALALADGNSLISIDTGDLYRAGTYRLNNPDSDSSAYWQQALGSFDDIVGIVLDNMAPEDTLIIVAPLSMTTTANHQDDSYAPVIIYGNGLDGELRSDSLGRDGLISNTDITATILSLANLDTSMASNESMVSIANGTESTSASVIASQLSNESKISYAFDQAQFPMNIIFACLLVLAFGCSIVMLATKIKLGAKTLSVMIPVTRLLWIVAAALPLATYLTTPILLANPTPEMSILICCALTLAIALAALIFGKFTKWINSFIIIMFATVVVIAVDQLFGAHLASYGFLTYHSIEGFRCTGIGNEGAAVLFGAWIMLSGLLLNRFSELKIADHFRRWLFPVMSFAILAIIIAPWWGANFGAMVWGVVGVWITWWQFLGHRLTWKMFLLTILACGFLTLGLVLADGLIGGSTSHLGDMAYNLIASGLAYIPKIVSNIMLLSAATFVNYPILSAALVLFWIYLAILRIRKPGPYKVFWSRNQYFKAAFTASMIVAVITLVIEDSGILMPALVLIYSTAGLTWMICDLHRWQLRAVRQEQGLIGGEVIEPIGGFKIEDSDSFESPDSSDEADDSDTPSEPEAPEISDEPDEPDSSDDSDSSNTPDAPDAQ